MNKVYANTKSELSLTSLKGQNRVVIAKVSDQSSLLTKLKVWPVEQREDRKLRIFIANKNQTFEVNSDATLNKVTLNRSELDSIALDNETIALIGLDGGVKARFSVAELNPSTINGIIDSMPMRMAESYN